MEEKDAEKVAKAECTFGEMTSHKLDVRGVTMSATDNLFATNSFDCVKVWSVDLASGEGLQIDCK